MKQEKNERMEVYYERLLMLTNILQHGTTNSLLITILRYGLQLYLHVATTSMKRKNLQQHKEVALVHEEGIFEINVISNLLVPKTTLIQKPQKITKKTLMYCTNSHMTNHNEFLQIQINKFPLSILILNACSSKIMYSSNPLNITPSMLWILSSKILGK